MACLAEDINFRPRGMVAVTGGIVFFLKIRRMAFRAHEVPVLRALGPMQFIVVINVFVGIQVISELTARLCGSAVPDDGQGLQSAAWQRDQILL